MPQLSGSETAGWLRVRLFLINRVNKTGLWKVGVKILSVQLLSRETQEEWSSQAYADFAI